MYAKNVLLSLAFLSIPSIFAIEADAFKDRSWSLELSASPSVWLALIL
jgi:hypothetical protein